MILVKTSLWIDHLRETDETPGILLETGQVLAQAFVIGELALGSLANRDRFLRLTDSLPNAGHTSNQEIRAFIVSNRRGGSRQLVSGGTP